MARKTGSTGWCINMDPSGVSEQYPHARTRQLVLADKPRPPIHPADLDHLAQPVVVREIQLRQAWGKCCC